MSVLIHLENLQYNISLVRNLIGPNRKICLPVKAEGYGHGMVPIAKAALDYGCDYLSVARTREIRELREAGINAPVMIMGHVPRKEMSELIDLEGELFAGSLSYLEALAALMGNREKPMPLKIHLKVDTGMGRIGCPPEEVLSLANYILESPHLTLKGLCTHFPVSDEITPESIDFTQRQIEVLDKLSGEIKELPSYEGEVFLVHGANSGGTVQHEKSYFDMVRPGILLYGYEPVPTSPLGIKPLMELTSELIFVKQVNPGESLSYGRTWTASKKTWVGTIPLGYGDGFSRLLSNKGKVWIKGKAYPVAGRICMDQFMVDLGSEKTVNVGEMVTLFGPDPCPFSAADIAQEMDTISYEVCCLINRRVPRIYLSPQ